MFQNMDKLKALKLDIGSRTGNLPNPMLDIPADVVVECLVFCTDQEQSQITGGEFILTCGSGLGCTGVRLSDDYHRWNNDLGMAVAKAGLTPAEKAATLIFNIGYGPWQKTAFFHHICAQDKPAKLAFDLEALAAALD